MKKRNLGRIAALGLAGLTAVPVVAMPASAAISITPGNTTTSSDNPQLSGTVYRVTWQTKAVATTYSYTKNDSTGLYEVNTTGRTTEQYATKGNTESIEGNSLIACDDVYYAYSDITPSTLIELEAFVKQSEADSTQSKRDNDAAMTEYNAHVNAKKTAANSAAAATSQKGSASFRTADGRTVTVTATGAQDPTYTYAVGSNAIAYTEPTVNSEVTVTDYTVTKSSASNITMKQLADVLGTTAVYMDNKGIISSSDNGGKQYTLNTTGSNTNNNGTVNAGDYYPVYASPIDTISMYTTPTYVDAVYYDYIGFNYWPNLNSLRAYYGVTSIPSSLYTIVSRTGSNSLSSGNRYFDYTNGNYYSSSNGNTVRMNTTSNYYYTRESGVYKNSKTGLYYLSYSAAYNADTSGTITRYSDLNTTLPYFSMVTGGYYSSYVNALYASNNNSSRVITVNNGSTYDYLDPYYYYYMNGASLTRPTTDTSAVTIGNRSGWTNVASYARNAKSGASYNVSMNGETVVPSTVLSAIKGRNVTMNFTLKNGVVYSINGNDVSSAKDLDIDTTYNTKNIPSKLVSKAKSVNDGVSTSQLSIDGGSFGSSADVTVKFATKRAGCTARLYRYNADRNTLSLVSKSSVGSNGKCTFGDVTKGGDYVIVLS